MPTRLGFLNCVQKPNESIMEYENRIRNIGRLTKYENMTDPLNELMRDRFSTGVHNEDLRTKLLHHYHEDGTTVHTFADHLAKAKAWEAAHKTNITIKQTVPATTSDEIHYARSNNGNHGNRQQPTQRQHDQTFKPSWPCNWCGGPSHRRKECPANKPTTMCSNCGMRGNHFTKVCRAPPGKAPPDRKPQYQPTSDRNFRGQYSKRQAHFALATPGEMSNEEDEYVAHSFSAYSLINNSGDKYFTWLPISVDAGRTPKILVQLDCGATCSTLPSRMYDKLRCPHPLKPSRAKIYPYAGAPLRPIGKQTLVCEGRDNFELIDFEIIHDGDIPRKPALLSGVDSVKLGLITFDEYKVVTSSTSDIQPPDKTSAHVHDLSTTKQIHQHHLEIGKITQEDLVNEFKNNFTGLGRIGKPAHIDLKSEVTPVHAGIHRIPVAKLDKVKAKLDEMVDDNKLVKVEEPTDWCSNMTVREKTLHDGSTKVRICLDPSQTINKAIAIPRYQIPTTQEVLPRLSGKKFKTFSIFDALDGFTQVELDEESSYYTTMHTPWGRYRWVRLPYGVSSAPEEFQRRIHEALDGLRGVHCIADDILVVGQGNTREAANEEHDQNVLALMVRSGERHLKLNARKIQYKLQKISFMGSILDEEGIRPDPSMVAAITNMPTPGDKAAILRFCGMANYLSQFCPNLSQTIRPLFEMTKADREYIWSPVHQAAFDSAKCLIAQAPCLRYFDITKQIVLQVDASQGGLGGALLQPTENGQLQPVSFTSCRMRSNEEAWAQIEKECLAIVSACDKWDLWLYGQEIIVHTDHQPLETIFRKPLRAAPRRLQKMMLRLQRYNVKVHYKKGTSLVLADTLSRATQSTTNDSKQTNFEVFRIILSQDVETDPGITSKTMAEVKIHTSTDPSSKLLSEAISQGWPEHKTKVDPTISHYWTFRDELTINDGVVYKGLQVVIPVSMRTSMLRKIHAAHLGPESNIRMAADVLFWPGMKADIREICRSCGKCAQFKSQNTTEPMKSQPIPEYPFQFVSQDLATFEGANYLVTVDHYSDFLEVDELDDTLSRTIVHKTEAQFARHGVPEILLTDNGPQFIASEYEGLCNRYHIQHITSSPYWPQGNGKAEATVKIVKQFMKKSGKNYLNEALLTYRNTPPQGHSLSPSQRCNGRRLRGLLPVAKKLLIPNQNEARSVQEQIVAKRTDAKAQYDKKASGPLSPLSVGEFVYVKPSPHHKGTAWPYGVITEIPSPRSYVVDTPTRIIRRNRVHVRPAAPPPAGALIPRKWQEQFDRQRDIESRPQHHPNVVPSVTTMVPTVSSSVDESAYPIVPSSPEIVTTQAQSSPQVQQSRVETKSPIITRSGRISKPKQIMDL